MGDLSWEERRLLGMIFCDTLEKGSSVVDELMIRVPIGRDLLSEQLVRLSDLGLLNGYDQGRLRLTEDGRRSIRVVFVGGVFDIIHPGHIFTIRESRKLGDVLIVSVARDERVLKMKGRRPINSENRRVELVSSIKHVDAALLGSEKDIFDTVMRVRPDVIALGYDQKHSEKNLMEEAARRNLTVEIVRLGSPIPEMKSSILVKNGDILTEI